MPINKMMLKLGALCIAFSFIGSSVWATNGYFSHGTGTKSKGMGGAGVALPQDALASATNPAGLTMVEGRLDVGGALFNPNRDYSVINDPAPPNNMFTNSAQESGSTLFTIPHIAYNKVLGGDSALGVALFARGGMNTDYPLPVFNGSSSGTGINLEQLFLNVTYARKIGDLSLGISGILAYQTFEARGLQAFDNSFFSANPGSVTNKGTSTSTGIGLSLGAIFKVKDGLNVGFSYTPAIDMSEFSEYKGLFAEGGDFDIPSTYILGASWQLSEKLTLAFDYQKINYTDVASVSNSGPTKNPAVSGALAESVKLGGANGFGFGWKDISVMKIGAAFAMNAAWTLRAGLNIGDQPIPNTETMFNILAPGVTEKHLTLGFTKTLANKSELNFAYMYAFENTVTGQLPAEFGGSTASLSMDQNELELSYGMKF